MPKIRRERIPAALMIHLLARVKEREIPIRQLELFSDWTAISPHTLARPFSPANQPPDLRMSRRAYQRALARGAAPDPQLDKLLK
ncbi:MAG: hypothetical protein ABI680_09115 [Chthoniobacteraceae bacterium]